MKFSTQALWLMTPELETRLRRLGIVDSDQLLAATRSKGSRAELARATGLRAAEVRDMAVRADLARVRGIGSAYAELLQAAGVESVPALAACQPEALQRKLRGVNGLRWITARAPSLRQVVGWVAVARELPAVLE